MKKWTETEINFLKENYSEKGKKWCALNLNKSEASIRAKTSELKIKQNRNSEFFKDWQARAAKSKEGKKRPEHSKLMIIHAKNGRIPQITNKRTPEQRKLMSERTKERLKLNGHPRGFLGKKRTIQEKNNISLISKKMWSDPNHKVNSKEYRQMISDKMTIMQNNRNQVTLYSNAKNGTIEIGGQIFFARSSWEANIGAYLQFLKDKKQIKNWEHEPKTFWFNEIKRGVRSYKPDFLITRNNDSQYFIEVKGYMDAKSITKLSRMKKYYPEIEIELLEKNRYNEIKKNSKLIPNWGLLDSDTFISKQRICKIENCNTKHFSAGYCSKHFYYYKKELSISLK